MKNAKEKLLQERFRLLLDDYERFFEYSQKPLRKSLRVNTLKTTRKELEASMQQQNFTLRAIPWAGDGFWVEGNGLSETVDYFLGRYYIQESSAMLPAQLLQPGEKDAVLDVAAAPGGKTTHLAALMNNYGCIAANEINKQRRAALRFNLSKYGVLNAAVTAVDFSRPVSCRERFSRILLDAPCSCEGQFRKKTPAREQWSPAKILACSRLQKKMIASALRLLDAGGVLVYSTCTLAPEENEEVVDYALRNNDDLTVEPVGKQDFNYRRGVTSWNGKDYSPEVKNCVRVYPQDNDSEGSFIGKIVKGK